MGYTTQEKALAIHRIVKCGMDVQWIGDEAEVSCRGWQRGEDLLQAVRLAFKVWEQRWVVERERDVGLADGYGLDATEVARKPPRDYYAVPDALEQDYAEVYNILEEYKARWNYGEVNRYKGFTGEGSNIVEKAKSFRDQMVAQRRAERDELAKRLEIN